MVINHLHSYSIQNKKKIIINIGLFILLCLVIATITTLYVSSERYLYFWDSANYPNQTSDLASAFRTSIGQGFETFFVSLSTDYNKIPCLPLVPFVLIFGNSRLVYILSSALVYNVPFALVMGALATKIIPGQSRAVFWSTAFLTVLIPTTLLPTLRGYPDIGAAFIIGLALLVYLKDVKLKQWWQPPLLGFLLALALLFRRHFAYSARAFLGAMILWGLLIFLSEVRNNARIALRNLTRYGILIGLVSISSLVTLMVLAPEFTKQILTTNFRSLYASYEQDSFAVFQYLGLVYGWLIWFLAILGISAGIVTRILIRPAIYLIVIFGILSIIQWILLSKQMGVHYTTHFSFVIVLGISSLIWTIWLTIRKKLRSFVLGSLIIIVIMNLLSQITTGLEGILNNPVRPLFGGNHPPLVRKDYGTMVQLIEYLRNISQDKQAVYVASSSIILNNSLVIEGERQLYGRENGILNVLMTSDIDSRDFYPIQQLLEADYVIVATPFQHAVAPQEADVVKVVVDAFTDNSELAQDFERLPEQFVLENNVIVSIFRRSRLSSPETALHTLKTMQEQIQPMPGSSYYWMSYGTQPQNKIWFNGDRTVNIKATFKMEPASFLYFGPLPQLANVSGIVKSSTCSGFKQFSIRLATLNKKGDVIKSKELIYSSKDSNNFSLPIESLNAAYIRFDLVGHNKTDNISSCSVHIENLGVF